MKTRTQLIALMATILRAGYWEPGARPCSIVESVTEARAILTETETQDINAESKVG